MIEVRPVTRELMRDAEEFFGTSSGSEGCFCMWFIIPVMQYHAGGREANRQLFRDLAESSDTPVGLLAYRGDEVVGWCATGPRSRYARAIKTPTFKGRDPDEDGSVWIVPCFYVHGDARREGVATALLEGAVALASEHGATAIEGFPFAEGAKRTKETMVGDEAIFATQGFTVTRRPSAARVVMRRELAG